MKPKCFKNHLVHSPPAPEPSSNEPGVATDGGDDNPEEDGEDELGYPGTDSSVSLVHHTFLNDNGSVF